MCGIYGAALWRLPRPEDTAAVERMGAALHHRGPDGDGVALDRALLGCARLRVIDTSERGDQPFAAPDGSAVVVCNGEIYNSGELRAKAGDYPFRSRSDVETLVPFLGARGADGLAELDGMFGLALWRGGELLLARDRAGEKPLVYARRGAEVWFASEPAALLQLPWVDRSLDPTAVSQLLTLGYVLEPRTMFAGIRQVPAGSWMRFGPAGESAAARYWRPEELAPFAPAPAAQRVEELRERLRAAARRQVVADVPVGVFMSGGLDSSLLAALAVEQLGGARVHTFAAAFDVASYDESSVAAQVAARLGTVHTRVTCDEPALREALVAFTTSSAEPLADPAVLPTWLLARAARQRVTVVLSGEGADELFGGYPTYLGHRAVPMHAALPRPLRALIASAVGSLRSSREKVTLEFLLKRFLADAALPWPERHLHWFGTGLPEQPGERRAEWMTPLLGEAASLGDERRGPLRLDYRTYLRDDLLLKVDRATMLHSIEARAPFLDRDVTAFAWQLPPELQVRRFQSKWILKRAARAWLPREVIARRKRGLSVPVASWLANGLGAEADRLLAPERLRAQGILDPEGVPRLLAEHRAGAANHARSLWAALTLQMWIDRWASAGARGSSSLVEETAAARG